MTSKPIYFKWISRPGSVARDEPFITYALNKGLKSLIALPAKGGNVDYYMHHDSFYEMLNNELNDVLSNPEKHFIEYPKKRENLVSKAKKLKESVIQNKDNEEILKLFEEYVEVGIDYCIYVLVPFALENLVEPKILKEFPDDFEIITSLDQPLIFHNFQKSLLKDETEEILKKYSWLNVYSPIHKPYIKEQIEELKKSTNKEDVEKIFRKFEENKAKFKKFISKVQDSEKNKLCRIMHEYAFLRTDRIDAWKEALFHLATFYGYVGKLVSPDCNINQASELFIDEVKNILQNKRKPELEDLKLRAEKKGLFYYSKESSKFVKDGTKEKEELLALLEKSLSEVTELSGMIANKGKVIGKVKIIHNKSDFSDFKDGQVLVAKFTEPEYTPYMKKACAIITDEGGITSHATITSRELNKPCIINTKIATQVLNDGDTVEVDANKGTVKILERAK